MDRASGVLRGSIGADLLKAPSVHELFKSIPQGLPVCTRRTPNIDKDPCFLGIRPAPFGQ